MIDFYKLQDSSTGVTSLQLDFICSVKENHSIDSSIKTLHSSVSAGPYPLSSRFHTHLSLVAFITKIILNANI